MSNLIGDYIHYKNSNYKKYNLGKDSLSGPDLSTSIQNARLEASNLLKMVPVVKNTQAMSTFLTNLIYHKDQVNDFGITPEQAAQYEQEFLKLAREKFPVLEANLENLTLTNTLKLSMPKINTKNNVGIKQGTIRSAADAIDKLLAKLKTVKKTSELTAMIAEAKNIKARLRRLIDEAKKDNSIITYESLGEDNILNDYNNLVKSIQGPTKEDLGTLAEMYFAYMLAAAGEVKIKSLRTLMNSFVAGAQRSHNQFTNLSPDLANLVAGKLNENNRLAPWSTNVNGGVATMTQGGIGSQGTVDMTIQFKNSSAIKNEFGVDRLNASIKNYASIYGRLNSEGKNEGIHIISGYSVMSALMLFDTDFANHYLNLLSTHPDGNDSAGIAAVNEVLTEGVVVRALTGARGIENHTKELLSNVFIVNDRGAGLVRVESTAQMIERIYGNLDKYITINGLPTIIENKWAGGKNKSESAALERIASLIANAHRCKLNMSLKPDYWK